MSLNNTDGAELARAMRMLAVNAVINPEPDLTITQVGTGFTSDPAPATVPQEVAAALTPPTFDLDALLDAARANMKLPQQTADGELPATDPDLINTLVARADELKRTSDLAIKERAKITGLLKEMVVATRVEGAEIPAKTSLTVHGAPVFVVNHVVKRELDQAAIKAKHPDIAKWAMYWKESSNDTGLYK